MRSSSFQRWALTVWTLSLVACPGKVVGPPAPPGEEPEIPLSPHGLDERPSNPTCVAPGRPASEAKVGLQRFVPNLNFNQPLLFLQAPQDTARGFVVERTGRIKVFSIAASTSSTTDFADLTDRVNWQAHQEAGLFSMAFHPTYPAKREVFISYTGYQDKGRPATPNNLESIISRFTVEADGSRIDPASEQVLIRVTQPYNNHNGGHIAFGPEGFLYIGLGDGGDGGDPGNRAQNPNTLLGKFLRINVDGALGTDTPPYAIPSDNPFQEKGGGRGEIFALGFRNPWRWSFDRETGDLWAGDVGQSSQEEVDRVVLGGNYGWRLKEGNLCYNPGSNCNPGGLIDPVVVYGRDEGISITGGYVYRGSALPALVGRFLYADYQTNKLWAVGTDPITGAPFPLVLMQAAGFPISSFGQLHSGELVLLNFGGGSLHQLVPAEAPAPSNFPQTLSATGCVDAADAKRPATGLIPYDVNAPLWSDGAEKERFLGLPDGERISVNEDGDFDLPVGTVLMKTFKLGEQWVETRLFMRHSDGDWAGYSYEWNEAQTDATLLPSSKSKTVGNQRWNYPSRAQCMQCHTRAAGFTLGMELAQLQRPAIYPSTGRRSDQIATYEAIGLFEGPLPTLSFTLPAPSGSTALEPRARAYLHSNCSGCHRPEGSGRGPLDFRASVKVADMKACDVTPVHGALGITNGKLIAPGSVERSVVSKRMHSLDAYRMPQLGTHVVDPQGTELIDAWIASLATCPAG